MFRAVFGTLTSESNQPLIADFPGVLSCVSALGTQIDALENLVSVQTDRPGYSQEKADKQSDLAQLATEICGAVLSHATASGNSRLAAKFDVPASTLTKGKDSRILAFCRNLHKTASPLIASLASNKITPDTLGVIHRFSAPGGKRGSQESKATRASGQIPDGS